VRGIKVLRSAGATTFMVWNMPNIGATPALNRDPAAVGAAIFFTAYFNGRLGEELLELSEEYKIDIKIVDVNGKLEAVVTAPAEFGLSNTTQACISLEAPFTCAQPNDYLFWDGIHPSAAGHSILAHEAGALLAR
jgi:phospholipase/lecithinase/hemolysin